MSSIVFILGAGASKMAGAPLMNEFLDTSYNLWKMGMVSESEKDFMLVFKAVSELQKVHSKSQLDIINIESVFSAFEMAKTLKKFSNFSPQKTAQLSKAMRQLIVKTIEKTIIFQKSPESPVPPKPYMEFSELLYKLHFSSKPKQTVSVITFNYDMCVDYALYSKNIHFDYGLKKELTNGYLPLLKLHGSLNWGYCAKCKSIIPFELDEYCRKNGWHTRKSSTGSHYLMEIGSNLNQLKHCGKSIDSNPAIVPPTWNKTDYHRTLSSIWSHAAKQLSESENIFIIGYSLPQSDTFFRYLYALGTVGESTLRRFWVINKDDSGLTEKRYKELLGPGAEQRFEYKLKRFDQIIPDIQSQFRFN